MLRQWLSGAPLTVLPVVGMCLFLAFFLLVLLRVSRRSQKANYDRMAALPLQDEASERSLS
jgi:cbb3-type cytochrome oxidase subunit 3